jgi:antibiotic biosynthesis monooxygenase (ABM) superfamily enzyme
MQPTDEEDWDKWYREEHLDMLSKVPGYRRSQRYRIGAPVPVLTRGEPIKYLTVHEFDHLDGMGGPESQALSTTEWTKKNVAGAKAMIVRGFERVFAKGFTE